MCMSELGGAMCKSELGGAMCKSGYGIDPYQGFWIAKIFLQIKPKRPLVRKQLSNVYRTVVTNNFCVNLRLRLTVSPS